MLKKIGRLIRICVVLLLLIGCGNKEDDAISSDQIDSDYQEGVVLTIPAIGNFWSTVDGTDIYYFENGMLYKYDTVSKEKNLITKNIMDSYDICAYDGTIYTVEHVESTDDTVRLFSYNDSQDEFTEVADLPEDTIDIYAINNYLIVVRDVTFLKNDDEKYLVYSLDDIEEMKNLNNDGVVVEQDAQIVNTDDSGNILYNEDIIFENSNYGYDVTTLWGYNDDAVYISAIVEGEERFFKIPLDGRDDIVNYGADIKKVAVYDGVVLIKTNSGEVKIE